MEQSSTHPQQRSPLPQLTWKDIKEPIFSVDWEGQRVVIHFGEGARLGRLGFNAADIRRLAAAFQQYAISGLGSSDGDT